MNSNQQGAIALEAHPLLSHDSARSKAVYYQETGQWEEALAQCQAALALNQEDWDIHILQGDLLLHLGRWEPAVSAYQNALAARPDTLLLAHKVAIALSQIGKLAEADDHYSRIFAKQADFEKKHPGSLSIQQQAGDYFFRQQDWPRAVSAYQKAVEIEPADYWQQVNLGRSLAKIDRYPEAIAALRAAIALDEQSGWAYYHLAEILFEEDKLSDSLKLCRKAALIMPDCLELKNLIAQIETVNVRIEQTEQQKEATDRGAHHQQNAAATLSPSPKAGSISGWKESYELGKQLQTKGDLEAAIKAYYHSIIKNPNHAWSYHDLGDVHLKLGNWHEAIAAYQQAITLNPDYFWSNYNLGVAYRNINDWQSTVELYQRTIQLNPGVNLPVRALEDTLKAWYDTLMKEGDQFLKTNRSKALDLYRRAIAAYRDNVYVPPFSIARERRENLSVLLIVDNHLGQCMRYRVEQKVEQLEYAGFDCEYYAWTNIAEATNKLSFFDVVIFYRTPAFTGIIKAIKYAKTIKKIVFYEIDDLIFDPELFPEPIESYGGQVTEEQYNGLVKGTVLFQEAMKMCDLAIASTRPLLKQIEKVVGKGNCYLHRNALDSKNTAVIAVNTPKVPRDYVSIFYGSGTKAHNSDFDELVAPALVQILEKHDNVRITLMGYLTIPDILSPYSDRIDRVDLVKDVVVYYEFLKQADIAIAVLHPTIVNNCKSELKWFEAASFKVPTVVSNTEVYLEVVQSGKDGFIAADKEDWLAHLDSLVSDESLRTRMGEAAYAKSIEEYSIPAMAKGIHNIVTAGIASHSLSGDMVPRSTRKKLLVVNVFYPPQSIGGATRIVKDNVDILTKHYGHEYEVSVFTTDDDNPEPYKILEYSHQGVPVTKVSTPMMEGMDWQYQNPRMYEIFKDYLTFHQPDLIHFHCVQRLTASVLEAAADAGIPYFVTAHDAWWISDHQFLVNPKGMECDYQQNDPLVATQHASDITDSIQRQLYLRKQLNSAVGVLAVSETFTQLYRQNGFPQTQANRNGLQPKPAIARAPSTSGRVRLAHIGGMAAHKGYFLFKEAVEAANLANTEIIIINHAQSPGTTEHGNWNGTPVTFLAKFKQDEINKLYSMVDVLVAPSMWPESFGLVTREAAAAGVWVVTSDKGAIGEDVIPKENGHICSVETADDLIAALKEIDENFKQYQTINENIKKPRTTISQVEELERLFSKAF